MKTRIQVQFRHKGADVEEPEVNELLYRSTLDAIKKIVREEGISGLYAGVDSSLIGVASTNFVYFYWYSVVRTLYLSVQRTDHPPNTTAELSLGAVAGALAQIFTIPVSVITTRQQTQANGARKSIIETGREVVKTDDGWSGLWRGLKASLVLVVNPAITYGAYQRLRLLLFSNKANLRPWKTFGKHFGRCWLTTPCSPLLVLGALAKGLATMITQPLIVAKVGLQSRPPATRHGKPFQSFVEVMRYIVEHEGPLSLFKGLGPQVTKGILVQGLLMMIKDR